MTTYKVVRVFMNKGKRVIKTRLTLKEAQKHCQDPESSYKTVTSSQGKRRTRQHGPWTDVYYEE